MKDHSYIQHLLYKEGRGVWTWKYHNPT